ncbi:S8 family serine peptidase [Streptomyces sp. SID3343]|uniref:S8 family serine peptidase n=1 Tax=Streptomyces sp. SID3343 TaxID=2690260 RepID=UPI001368E5B8|nr:S8 family serine peptidase [Streptomyces sp. SID3343]MYW00200.1 S8 family serine peptidase [Streptomyces sp. SID3343]
MSGRLIHAQRAPLLLALLMVVLLGAVWTAPPARADSVRAAQWYLDSWKIEEAWKVSTGKGITVAVVDSGVDASHPDLVGQVLPGLNASDDKEGHGTGMASLIAGQGRNGNGQGAYGIAPGAKILPFSSDLAGMYQDTGKIIDGIRLAADSPARIINLSVGSSRPSPQLAAAVEYAQSKGKLLVAAGGNTTETPGPGPIYPAAYPGVLGVGGLDRQGAPSSNAIAGSWISISGPGTDVPAACTKTTHYCIGTGSSNAAALTSGVAALVWSAHPDWTANQVIKRLIDTANRPTGGAEVPSDSFGWGSVSPRQALNSTDPPGPAEVNPLIGKRGLMPSTAPQTGSAPNTATPQPATPAAAAPPVDKATGSTSDDDNSTNLVPIAAGGAGVAVLVAVGAALIIRNRRRARAEEEAAARAYAAPNPQWSGGPQPPPYGNGGWPPYQN